MSDEAAHHNALHDDDGDPASATPTPRRSLPRLAPDRPVNASRLTDTLDFHAAALTLRSQRQQLIAANIANADTPGYVARDMDFAAALRQATTKTAGGAAQAAAAAPARPGHIALSGGTHGGADLLYATPSQTSLDRNTVDMDRERARFADNALRYEATLRFVNAQVKTLLGAITGQ